MLRDDALRSQRQDTYRYVLVDEFQDVSRAQFHLLDALTAGNRNYMVIGDADQCICRWRGADPDRLVLSGWGLWERYWRTVPLDEIERVQRGPEKRLRIQVENGSDVSLLFREPDHWARSIRVHSQMHAHRV
jgi:RIO-like serine/threonine protein kinase